MLLRPLFLAAALGNCNSATLAQSTNGNADRIVVTGKQMTEDEARSQVANFVRQTGVANGSRPAARWSVPVCPRVLGLAGNIGGMVEAKMRAIAAAADVPVAREPCTPNIAVAFTTSGDGFVRALVKRSPRRISEVSLQDRDALLRGGAPIRWFYSTRVVGRDGRPMDSVSPLFAGTGEGGRSVLPSRDDTETLQQFGSSIISTQARRGLTQATVVFDSAGVDGLPLDSVTAYASLVAFAEIRPLDETPSTSILSMFKTGETPRSLTEWDTAFLRGLYRLPLDREARQHRRLLVRELLSPPKQP